MTYEILETKIYGEPLITIKYTDKNGNNLFIPNDINNSDYQAYLRWLENPNPEIGGN